MRSIHELREVYNLYFIRSHFSHSHFFFRQPSHAIEVLGRWVLLSECRRCKSESHFFYCVGDEFIAVQSPSPFALPYFVFIRFNPCQMDWKRSLYKLKISVSLQFQNEWDSGCEWALYHFRLMWRLHIRWFDLSKIDAFLCPIISAYNWVAYVQPIKLFYFWFFSEILWN